MGAQPDFRIIKKSDDGKKWETIGAAWKRDNGEGFSISLEPNGRGGEKVKYLMVENKPKPQQETAPASSGAVTPPQVEELNDEIPF